MTFATHYSPAGRGGDTARRLNVLTKGRVALFSRAPSAIFADRADGKRIRNQRTWATSTAGVIVGSGAIGSAGCGPTRRMPGNKKSSGETLLDALMPLQPLINTMRAQEVAPIATFKLGFKSAV